MNLKATLVLAALLVALCLGYGAMVLYEGHVRNQQEESKKLFPFTPDDLVEVEVQQADDPPSAAVRPQGAQWAMSKPNPNIEANQVLWNRVAAILAGLVNERTIDSSPSDLAAYGLDKPVLTVTARTQGGDAIRLVCGAADPTQSDRYAMLEAGKVFLIGAKAFNEMNRPLNLLRNPYVFTVGPEGVTRLEYARFWTAKPDEKPAEKAEAAPAPPAHEVGEESVAVVLEKSAEGAWRLTAPIQAPANSEQVDALVKEVQFATGHDYVEEPKDLSDYGLKPPKARITLSNGVGSEPQSLLLGSLDKGDDKKPGGLFAKLAARPAVFLMDATVMTLLPKTPDAFRENRLLTHAATDIKTIHYVCGQTDITLENDPDHGWRMTQAGAPDTDQLSVSNLVATLKAMQGRGFPGDAQPAFGLDNPTISFTFTFKNDAPPATIRVGARAAGLDRNYATQDNGVVTLLNNLDVAALTKTVFDFRKRTLLAFDVKGISELRLQFEGVKYVFQKPQGLWIVREPSNRRVESQGDMNTLLKVLHYTSAVAIDAEVQPTDLAPYGLDAPIATVSVTTIPEKDAPEKDLGPLQIGAPAADNAHQRYAVSALLPGLYRVPQSLIDDIRETLKVIR